MIIEKIKMKFEKVKSRKFFSSVFFLIPAIALIPQVPGFLGLLDYHDY